MSERRTGLPVGREAALAAFRRKVAAATSPLVPSGAIIDTLLAAAIHQIMGPRTHLHRAGEVAGHVYFLHRGLVRYYYCSGQDGGEERTGQFFEDGSVFADAASFLARQPGAQSFEVLEESSILSIPHNAISRAYDADHAMERFGRRMIEEALVGAQRRSSQFLTHAPDERYRLFVKNRPALARRVPQYMIASFLGLTPESLSRIRSRITRRRGPPR